MKKLAVLLLGILLLSACKKGGNEKNDLTFLLLGFLGSCQNSICSTVQNVRSKMVANGPAASNGLYLAGNSLTANSACWIISGSNAIHDARNCYPGSATDPAYTDWLVRRVFLDGHSFLHRIDQLAPNGGKGGGEGFERAVSLVIGSVNVGPNLSAPSGSQFFQNAYRMATTSSFGSDTQTAYWGKSSDLKFFYAFHVFSREGTNGFQRVVRIKMDIANRRLYMDLIDGGNRNRAILDNMDYTESNVTDGSGNVLKETALKIGANTTFTAFDASWVGNVGRDPVLTKMTGTWFKKVSAIIVNFVGAMNSKSVCFTYGADDLANSFTSGGLCAGDALAFAPAAITDYNFSILSAGNFTTAMATHQQLVDYYATRPIIWTAVDETLTTTADTYGKN